MTIRIPWMRNKGLPPTLPAVVAFICVGSGQLYSQQVIDKVVAVVGREAILYSDLQARTQFYAVQNRLDPNTPGLQKKLLDLMINDKLVLAKAVEDSVVVTDDELRQQLEERIKEIVQQYGSESRVEELYGMSINRMKREYRDDMKKELLKSKIQRSKFGNIAVSRREVEEFFETYRDSLPEVPEEVQVSHIYITPKPSAAVKRSTRERVQALLDSIQAGADFAAMAKKYSEDLGSASHGGDLGWARRGDFVKEFEERAFALKEGQLSDVVETPLGYHLVQMLERRGDAVHLRQILIKMERSQADDDSTIALLKSLKARVEAGEKFSDLAKKYSENEESASLGGDLGTLSIEQLQPEFLATVKTLSPGEISEPAKVTFSKGYGYHIAFLRKRTPEHKMSLTDDWKRLEQYALGYKRNQEYAVWIEELRRSIYWDSRL